MIPINQRIRFVLKLFSNYFFRSSRDDSSSRLTDRKNREILTMSFEIAKKKKKEKLRVKLHSYNFVREMFESSRVYSSRLNKFIYKLETIILFSKKRREEIFHKFIIHNTFEFQWRGGKKNPESVCGILRFYYNTKNTKWFFLERKSIRFENEMSTKLRMGSDGALIAVQRNRVR